MKRGPSTGKPTKKEAEWIVAVKEGPCLACLLQGYRREGCDAHHLLSGGRRRGHLFTIGLCEWHHRGVTQGLNGPMIWRMQYGPSLMDGSKLFRDAYGTDDELLEAQRRLLKTGSLL